MGIELEKFIFFTILVHMVCGQFYAYNDDPYNLNNLGSRISAQVQSQVAPLQGLGERINAQVQRNLQPLQSRLGELDGLGDRISAQVHKDLEPVRAIELNFKMRDGVGGTTIVTHQPSGRQFIYNNYKPFICKGTVDIKTGTCSGDLVPFEITSSSPQTDWCYLRSYSLINNQICIGLKGVSVTSFNNQITCKGVGDSPTFTSSLDDYKKLCSEVSASSEYRYIPDVNSPQHVAIPNQNAHVKCENRDKNLCIFHENNSLLNTYSTSNGFQYYSTGNNVNINVGGTY
ncbi:uncharacterized protein LOC115884888 [Sitophilus oryzae]|uniref:Uncharacterized protein LOC115884888 n=1 Tax=Sitophilus oryzae TaxID=7048 RepID=A0A6J2Y767_SITOR|nr:uncharacterized protein LOC115884888 [Sitophilus oryzae]